MIPTREMRHNMAVRLRARTRIMAGSLMASSCMEVDLYSLQSSGWPSRFVTSTTYSLCEKLMMYMYSRRERHFLSSSNAIIEMKKEIFVRCALRLARRNGAFVVSCVFTRAESHLLI